MRTLTTLLLLALGAGCQQVDLKEFSPDGSYKLLLPANREEVEQDPAGNRGRFWISKFDDGTLFFGASEIPSRKLSDADAEEILKASVQRNAREMRAEVVREEPIKLGDFPGRQFEAKVKAPRSAGGEIDGLLRERVYLAGDKLFILGALGKPDWVAGAEIARFLESLQITK